MTLSEKTLKEKCVCEGCNSKKILAHFERCTRCGSKGYHSTPKQLNPEEAEDEQT